MCQRPLTAVDLFAGAGGAALGLAQAGFVCLAHVEQNSAACATLRATRPHGEVIEADVRTVAWEPYVGIDLAWASPPCQGWSAVGMREGARDTRNGWPWTWAAADRLRPRWLLCENVPGLLEHQSSAHPHDPRRASPNPAACGRCYFEEVILVEARRRFTHVSWRLVDCADLGVPQRRRRLILACGPAPYAWPASTHRDPTMWLAPGTPWVSMRQALPHLETISSGTLAGSEPWRLDLPAPAVTATEVKGATRRDMTATDARGPERASGALWRATGRRRLSVGECATLQCFPADYPFTGTVADRYAQIGNAVPPTLAAALAGALTPSRI